jgi:hypothetical protein
MTQMAHDETCEFETNVLNETEESARLKQDARH